MFLVYDEITGKFQTGRQFPKLLLVSLTALNENTAKLEAEDMPILEFVLPQTSDETFKVSKCSMWWGEPLNCIDCGEETSAWISKFEIFNFAIVILIVVINLADLLIYLKVLKKNPSDSSFYNHQNPH